MFESLLSFRRPLGRTWLAAALFLAAAPSHAQPAREPFVDSSNAFAVDFYKALDAEHPGDNIFISPVSASTALTMTHSGARGATASEMASVLHLSGTRAEVDASAGRLLRQLGLSEDQQKFHLGRWWNSLMRQVGSWWDGLMRRLGLSADKQGAGPGRSGDMRLHVANAVWVSRGMQLAPGFQESMRLNYDSELSRVDFARGDSARKKINAWAAARTENRIRELLEEPPPGPMVLTSAVYMKADWARPFLAGQTEDARFNLTPSVSAPVRLMRGLRPLRHFRGPGFQLVRLPYAGDRLSMAVFLPDRVDGLAAFERGLTAARLEQWLGQLDLEPERNVQLALPRFRLELGMKLNSPLRRLGMRLPFTPAADFSGMTGQSGMFIHEVIQKTFVAVDEQGTEAAAVTAVSMKVDLPPKAPPPISFRADHPFLFLVRDERTGAVIFMGRLARPPG